LKLIWVINWIFYFLRLIKIAMLSKVWLHWLLLALIFMIELIYLKVIKKRNVLNIFLSLFFIPREVVVIIIVIYVVLSMQVFSGLLTYFQRIFLLVHLKIIYECILTNVYCLIAFWAGLRYLRKLSFTEGQLAHNIIFR
jgi:hypothetical protein